MIEFRYLPAFFAVAETGNFTEAARRLFIATSAVSRQVQLLEASCGVQLFFRSPQETKLTAAGKQLFEEMRHFQHEANRIIGERAVGQLNVGTLQGVLQHWLLPLMAADPFFKTLSLNLKVDVPSQLIAQVESGDLDATFFSYVNLTQLPASLKAHRLFREDVSLISAKKVALADAAKHPWVCFSAQGWLFQHQKARPERTIVVNDMNAVVDLVRRGMGVAMVPTFTIGDRKGLHVLPVKAFSKESIYLVTRKYEREPPLVTAFVESVRRHATV